MKKLAAIFLTLLFASTASAQVISNPTTNARMDGLGVNNWQIEDDFNIWINPAQLSNYKNAVYGELGTDPCTAAGACGDATTSSGINGRNAGAFGGLNLDASYGGWGVYLGRPYAGSLEGMLDPTTGAPLPAANLPDANRFDLFYSTHGMPLGFYLSYASQSKETTIAAVKTTIDASEINLGVGGLLMDGILDAAVNIGLPSYEDKTTGSKLEGDAGPNFALLVRHHAAAGGGKLLTTFQYLSGDMSTKSTVGAATAKLDVTQSTWSLDTALNSKPAEGTLLVAGIGITGTSSEAKTTGFKATEDSMAIPVNVGVEHQTFKKIQTRVGLSKDIYNTTECKDASGTVCGGGATKTTTVEDGAATVSMGLGWAVSDNLMLDAVINQDVLFTGSYLVSGIPETVSSKLSATYRFQ